MEDTGTISCIAVGDMLKNRLEEYTNALSSGADKDTLARMEADIDKIEAVHNKCVEGGNVTDVGTADDVVDEAEDGDSFEEVDSVDDWSRRVFEEDEEN